MMCIVCREAKRDTPGTEFVRGRGPYCREHAAAWEEYWRLRVGGA